MAALPHRDLREDVGGGAEAVDTERRALPRHPVAAPADQPGAQQRRRCGVVEPLGQREAIARIGDGVGGVATVSRVTREQRRIAEVFAVGAAIGADPAGRAEPRNADALADFETRNAPAQRRHPADDLVAGHDGQLGMRQFAIDHMQIGPAYAAGRHRDENFARSGSRHRPLAHDERLSGPIQHHGAHHVHGRHITLHATL